MSSFPNWQQYAVKQKRAETGCIPTGYEMILRAAGVSNIDFNTFQDEFDLDKNLKSGEQPRNTFESVADAINEKYPNIFFKRVVFRKGEGNRKLAAVEKALSQKTPILISLSLAPFDNIPSNGWHIMPVVDLSADSLILLWGVDDNGNPIKTPIRKQVFVDIHDNYAGGDDIAFLDKY